MDKLFTLQLSATKLNLLGGIIETQKTALDALSADIQGQVNAQLAAEAAEAARAARQTPAQGPKQEQPKPEDTASAEAGSPAPAKAARPRLRKKP